MEAKKELINIIGMFFYETNFDTMTVTAVDVEWDFEENVPVVVLTTRQPGILIGRHGRYIESLKAHLVDKMCTEVKMKIIEDTLWNSVPLCGEDEEHY